MNVMILAGGSCQFLAKKVIGLKMSGNRPIRFIFMLVAKLKGGFWVDSILLQHITSTFCMHSHTEISA